MDSFTTMRALVEGLAAALSLINPEMQKHHDQTAYLSYFIAREMGVDEELTHRLIVAALLHDVGAIINEDAQSVVEIERAAVKYARIGRNMLEDLPEFGEAARIIAYCQSRWDSLSRDFCEKDCECAALAAIIHLADVVATCLKPDERVLNQVTPIISQMEKGKGTLFMPEAVEALKRLDGREVLWLDIAHNPSFLMFFTGEMHRLSLEHTVQLTWLMSRIIDYRSPFTAMHSAGVAATARSLAKLCGMSEDDCMKMEIAGNLHDLGKLVVPRAILEKPGKLTAEEFNIVKEHPYYTRLVLMNIEGFGQIADWAALHHEKLEGSRGYPFHIPAENLDLGCRIMAVADIFSAITERRPYRESMPRPRVIQVLRENVGGIDGDIVQVLLDHYAEIDDAREAWSRVAGKRYFDSFSIA